MSRQINRFETKIPTMRFPSEPRGFTWLCKHLLEKASKLRNVTKAHHDCLMIQKLMMMRSSWTHELFFTKKMSAHHERSWASWMFMMNTHECSWINHEHSWTIMSVHECSWAFMSVHECSWTFIIMKISLQYLRFCAFGCIPQNIYPIEIWFSRECGYFSINRIFVRPLDKIVQKDRPPLNFLSFFKFSLWK